MDAAAAQAEFGKTYSFAAAVPTGSEISGQCTNKCWTTQTDTLPTISGV